MIFHGFLLVVGLSLQRGRSHLHPDPPEGVSTLGSALVNVVAVLGVNVPDDDVFDGYAVG